MSTDKPAHGEIKPPDLRHGDVIEKDIERRARELALMAGRSQTTPVSQYFIQALKELTGEDPPPASSDEDLDKLEEQKAIERLISEGGRSTPPGSGGASPRKD